MFHPARHTPVTHGAADYGWGAIKAEMPDALPWGGFAHTARRNNCLKRQVDTRGLQFTWAARLIPASLKIDLSKARQGWGRCAIPPKPPVVHLDKSVVGASYE
jgi:hypothetical protein